MDFFLFIFFLYNISINFYKEKTPVLTDKLKMTTKDKINSLNGHSRIERRPIPKPILKSHTGKRHTSRKLRAFNCFLLYVKRAPPSHQRTLNASYEWRNDGTWQKFFHNLICGKLNDQKFTIYWIYRDFLDWFLYIFPN